MKQFYDFYRNVTFFDEYDEHSFIGLWVNECSWSDEEYWKLEKALLEIKAYYSEYREVPEKVLIGLMRIVELMMVSSWSQFDIIGTDKNSNIYDRMERFKVLLCSIFLAERDFTSISFFYNK